MSEGKKFKQQEMQFNMEKKEKLYTPCPPNPNRKISSTSSSKQINEEECEDGSNQINEESLLDNSFNIPSISGGLGNDYDVFFENEELDEDFATDDSGGGGRNGGRSNMGDVMTLNEQNNGNNDMNYYQNNDYYANDQNYGNVNDDNNLLYEDNNNNFGDGLQIVVNGNDTNFFV